jgi:hypothetical protein
MADHGRSSPTDDERNYFAGAPTRARGAGTLLPLAAIVLLAAAWGFWSRGDATFARGAVAGPPASALNIEKRAANEEALRALDPGRQREELLVEIRALRGEVVLLRDEIRGGRLKVEVTNLAELKRADSAKNP